MNYAKYTCLVLFAIWLYNLSINFSLFAERLELLFDYYSS